MPHSAFNAVSVAPDEVTVWVCRSCGHWTANSYFHRGNPLWRPRCKMKDGCPKPEMVPYVYGLRRPAERLATPEEFDAVFGDLPSDGEG